MKIKKLINHQKHVALNEVLKIIMSNNIKYEYIHAKFMVLS